MNLSIKSTYPLFESICVNNGEIQHINYHRQRFQYAYQKFFWEVPQFDIFDAIEIPSKFKKGRVKLRISYGKTEKRHTFQHYIKKNIQTLKLVVDDDIDYDLKFEDRSQLNQLFDLRNTCDDVLIVKKGNITDTSYANIVFWDGKNWFTPDTYLLKGTKRSQLLNEGTIHETQISLDDLSKYEGFQLINAMLDFDFNSILSTNQIDL